MSEADSLVPGARYAKAPRGIVSTAWPRIAGTCNNIGWRFDPWQSAVGRLILAKKDGGGWAADLSILSIPRQVGKSYLLGCIIFALCLLDPKLRVIWTSHHTATTEEMFEAMKELAQHKRVKPHVVKCVALQGSRWRIQFRNGSRIDFGARSQGFGRGKAKIGVLVLDEFQHITSRALTNLGPTTNTADNPLILCAGTPPGPDAPGDAFAHRRTAALEGLSDDTLYVEFSADSEGESDDRRQWAKANPSFPKRTGERAFLLQRKILTEADFRRDMLGIWDQTTHKPVVTRPAWDAMVAKGVLPDVPANALGVDASPVGEYFAAGCWVDDDESHVELLPLPGDLVSVADLIAARCGRRMIPVVIHSSSPAKALVPLLLARKVHVKLTAGPDMATAAGLLVGDMLEGRFTHAGQKPLTDSFMAARKKSYGEAGAFVWDFTTEGVAPTIAATLARSGASLNVRQKTGRATFV
jgi:hypothetical protein